MPSFEPAERPPPQAPPTRDICKQPTEHFKRLYVAPQSLRRLSGPHMINDEAIYAGMAVLATHYPARVDDIAFLSPFEYKKWWDGRAVLSIMKASKSTTFWSRKVIIVPIHDPNMLHWLLAIVYPQQGQIEFFDSLALEGAWRVHGQVCTLFPISLSLKVLQRVAEMMTALLREAEAENDLAYMVPARWQCTRLVVSILTGLREVAQTLSRTNRCRRQMASIAVCGCWQQ